MIRIRVYTTPDGSRPFNSWFQGLDQATGIKVSRAISQMEQGNFSDFRSVGDGVRERRIHSGPGLRIYYGRIGRTAVLLLGGGTKRSQQADIRRALANWQEFRSR